MNEPITIVIEDEQRHELRRIERFAHSGRPIEGEEIVIEGETHQVVRVRHEDGTKTSGIVKALQPPIAFVRRTRRLRLVAPEAKPFAGRALSHPIPAPPPPSEVSSSDVPPSEEASSASGVFSQAGNSDPAIPPAASGPAEGARLAHAATRSLALRSPEEAVAALLHDEELSEDHTTAVTDARPSGSTGASACLVLLHPLGAQLGQRFELREGPMTIGRRNCDLLIENPSVSRKHARIERVPGKTRGKSDASAEVWQVVDLDSSNGTYVDGRPVRVYRLTDGCLLQIGKALFKFLSGGNMEAAYHDEIRRLAMFDGLTQIYNKRYFLEHLARELRRVARSRRPLSLVLFDIDHFKKINDQYGHVAGDAVLKAVAERVQRRVRSEEIFARYGGEEFVVVLYDTPPPEALVLAEALRDLVDVAPVLVGHDSIHVTVSLGVATVSDHVEVAQLIEMADRCLYEAKRSGRNRVVGAAPAAPLHLP